MAIGKAQRLEQRRKQGPSMAERWRGPNFGAWQKTHIPIRRYQGFRTGYSDGERFRPKDHIQH